MKIYQYNKDYKSGSYVYSFIIQEDSLSDKFTRVYSLKEKLVTESCRNIEDRYAYTTLILKLD
jgi:hypothetical protein